MNLLVLGLAVLLSAGSASATSDDLEDALHNLKQADAQKDAAQVKKLAVELCSKTRQITSAPAPVSNEEKDAWAKSVAYARALEVYAEYALSAAATNASPAMTIELLSTLEQQNPRSKYLDEAYGHYLVSVSQVGKASQVTAIAEKALANFPENEDLLLVLADTSLKREQSGAALGYAKRLVSVLNRHPRPEGLSSSDWDRKRGAALGRGYWMVGFLLSQNTQYFEADKNLRAALPLIKGDETMTASALYFLGVANYHLGKMTMNKAQVLEAAKFSEQAAAFKGPYSQTAWRNAHVMKTEATRMR